MAGGAFFRTLMCVGGIISGVAFWYYWNEGHSVVIIVGPCLIIISPSFLMNPHHYPLPPHPFLPPLIPLPTNPSSPSLPPPLYSPPNSSPHLIIPPSPPSPTYSLSSLISPSSFVGVSSYLLVRCALLAP